MFLTLLFIVGPASIKCSDCSFTTIFLCSNCDSSAHGNSTPHARMKLDCSDGGSSFLPPPPQILRVMRCTACTTVLDAHNSTELLGRSDHTMYTLGVHEVQVSVARLRCHKCHHVSGQYASEFNCIPGSARIWCREDLLDVCYAFMLGSNFSLTQQSTAKAVSFLLKKHGGDPLSRRESDALFEALR